MMNSRNRGWTRLALTLCVALPLVACDTDELLEVAEPTYATPESLRNEAGLPVLFAGAIGDFQVGYSGVGLADAWLANSSLFSDELKSADTFDTRNATDSRNNRPVVNGNTSDVAYNQLQYSRRSAAEIASVIEEIKGKTDARWAQLKALEGFTIVALGEGFCGAVPLGSAAGGAPLELGTPLTTQQLFEEAIKRFDEALAAAPTSNLAKVGKGRALLNLGRYADAAAAVNGVPTSFIYLLEHSSNSSRQYNPIYSLQDNRRYSMSDREGTNGLPYVSANDPRTAWYMHTQTGFDQATPVVRSARYTSYASDVVLADGIQARLIEAEAQLASGGPWLATLNALRADVRNLMSLRYTAAYVSTSYTGSQNTLQPLVDPGTPAARVDMLFSERGFWLYLTGTRLGDMRRLIRQYGRTAETVFPTGPWHKGGLYGTDVNLPIPFNEQQNPNYKPDMCKTNQA